MASKKKKKIQKKRIEQAEIVQPKKQAPSDPLMFSLIITGLFFIVALIGMLNHEMWRDEHQAWLVARDADSLPMLFDNMKYEGNPALWQFLLFLITRFTHNPVFMQALHLLIACGFIFVFNRYAPLKNNIKILFSFGYFPVYEYAVISRNYGFGVLLLFIACALYKNREQNYIWIGLVLALLANISIYTVVISSGIAGILVLDYFLYQQKESRKFLKLVAATTLFLTGIIFSLYQIWPEPDNSFPTELATTPFDIPRWLISASRYFSTYFYIPEANMHFWNTSIYYDTVTIPDPVAFSQWINEHPYYIFTWFILPLLVLFSSICIFFRRPLILMLYTGVTLGLAAVYYYTYLLHVRYLGHMLLALIACYWLAEYYPEKRFRENYLNRLGRLGEKIKSTFITAVLCFSIIGAVIAYAMEISYPFSASKEAAAYVKESGLDLWPAAGITDFTVSPFATYMDKKIYYLQMSNYGSFCRWDSHRVLEMNYSEWVSNLSAFMRTGPDSVLLLKDSAPQLTTDGVNYVNMEKAMITDSLQLDFIRYFEAGVVEDEKYYIYTVKKVDPATVNPQIYPRIN